jgi:hypothetical protein
MISRHEATCAFASNSITFSAHSHIGRVPKQIISIHPFPELLEKAKADGDSLLVQVACGAPSRSIAVAECDEERMDILDVSDKWSWDTGRPNYFMMLREAPSKPRGAEPLVVMFSPLASERSREWLLIPFFFRNAPAVISAGRRITHVECSAIWIQGKACCVVLPDLIFVPLDVVRDAPYIKEGGLRSTCRDPKRLNASLAFMFGMV